MIEKLRHLWAKRREAVMRAGDYAVYLEKQHGDEATAVARAKLAESPRWSYRWMLYRQTLKRLKFRQSSGFGPAPAARPVEAPPRGFYAASDSN